ncbi:24611_t:CDS:1, partial [Gigaspora rosea]
MRETQGRTIKGVRLFLSKRLHCIHSYVVKLKQEEKKDLSADTVEKSKAISTRIQDTNCPATLKIQLQNKHITYPCV